MEPWNPQSNANQPTLGYPRVKTYSDSQEYLRNKEKIDTSTCVGLPTNPSPGGQCRLEPSTTTGSSYVVRRRCRRKPEANAASDPPVRMTTETLDSGPNGTEARSPALVCLVVLFDLVQTPGLRT